MQRIHYCGFPIPNWDTNKAYTYDSGTIAEVVSERREEPEPEYILVYSFSRHNMDTDPMKFLNTVAQTKVA